MTKLNVVAHLESMESFATIYGGSSGIKKNERFVKLKKPKGFGGC
jgi:hypothetical protein